VNNGKFEMAYCSTETQLADILTKTIRPDRFVKLKIELGAISSNDLD